MAVWTPITGAFPVGMLGRPWAIPDVAPRPYLRFAKVYAGPLEIPFAEATMFVVLVDPVMELPLHDPEMHLPGVDAVFKDAPTVTVETWKSLSVVTDAYMETP
jgi:hypothetical protein